jgi:hypothetical protein
MGSETQREQQTTGFRLARPRRLVARDDYLALSTDGKKGDLRESVATSPL